MTGDLRLAWRMFRRGRGASLITVAMLAVAMAGTVTLFSVLSALTTMWPNMPERKRVARIYAANPRLGVQRDAFALDSLARWASALETFETIAAFVPDDRSVDGANDIDVQAVTPGFFEVFQIAPVAGRILNRADAGARAETAIVGERLARDRFGSTNAAIGKTIDLDGESLTIVGVMPRAFFFPTESAQVWIPLATTGAAERRVTGVGRLRDGKQWSEATAELLVLGARGNASTSSIGWTITPIPLDEDQSLRVRNGLIGLLGPALIVLLIACVNTTNLMLARGVEREGEFRVRLALGASRGRIVRQLFIEGGVIALLATAAGAALSVWGIRIFRAVVAGFNAPIADRIAFTSSTLLAVMAMAIATPIAVSIWPAVAASRPRPFSSMNATPSGRGRSGYGPRDLLVFAEVALASVLVVMALMVSRLYGELRGIHPSFDPKPIVVADVGPDVTAAALATLIEDARAVPGVAAAATIKGPLFALGGDSATAVVAMSGSNAVVPCSVTEVSADYFRTAQLPLVAGRTFDNHTGRSSGEAIVNAALARRLWGGQSLPGGPVTLRTNDRAYELHIIGIAAEALAPNDFGAANTIYLPRDSATGGPVKLLVRTAGTASSAVEPLARVLTGTAARKTLRFRPLAETIGRRDTDLVQWLLVMFSALALMLAAGGIFAVSRHAVLQRTREFGIRLSLGATGGRLIRMVLGRDLKLAGLAVVLAAGGTLAVTRFAFWEMLRLAMRDPFFWTSVLVILGGASTIACYVAVRRISRLQPMDALRDS
jgi:predicted permease